MAYRDLSICELGNQYMLEMDPMKRDVVAKEIYSSWGVRHVSIDLSGEDGALKIDLDKPVPRALMNAFDVVTNYGTIEHVNNQFQVFKNVHDMTRNRGIMIHTLPPLGNWPNHGRYYYPQEFVTQLAASCNYAIIKLTVRSCFSDLCYGSDKNLIMVAFQKKQETFIEKDVFDKLPLIDTGDLTCTGNYTKRPSLVANRWITALIVYAFDTLDLEHHPRARRLLRRLLFLKKRRN
jgi:hypothetical protein